MIKWLLEQKETLEAFTEISKTVLGVTLQNPTFSSLFSQKRDFWRSWTCIILFWSRGNRQTCGCLEEGKLLGITPSTTVIWGWVATEIKITHSYAYYCSCFGRSLQAEFSFIIWFNLQEFPPSDDELAVLRRGEVWSQEKAEEIRKKREVSQSSRVKPIIEWSKDTPWSSLKTSFWSKLQKDILFRWLTYYW